jgi:cytochrome c oxidase subunit 2
VALVAVLSSLGPAEEVPPAAGVPLVQAPEPLPIPVITGDVARGQQLFQGVCFACHGLDGAGKAELGSASLHQQEAWYLVAQLEKFRAGRRGTHPDDLHGGQMRPMSLTLPDEQALSDVALYVTSLEGPRPPATLTGDAEAGKTVYTNVCVVCHGEDAKGMPQFRSPALAGQSDWYVEKQVHKFRDGLRAYDPQDEAGLQMKAIISAIPDEKAIRDVTAYIATLP